MSVEVKIGQSMYDVAIQHMGSSEGLMRLVAANRHVNLSDDLTTGQLLAVPTPTDPDVVKYYIDKRLTPANGATIPLDPDNPPPPPDDCFEEWGTVEW